MRRAVPGECVDEGGVLHGKIKEVLHVLEHTIFRYFKNIELVPIFLFLYIKTFLY